ncbi:helicase-like protein [Tanacetum coccineum]
MHRRHRATNLKGKEIADVPNVAPPETGCKSTGAASISKRITVDLKGKTIADPNNVATTKPRRTTTGNERNNKGNKDQDPTFSLCCQQGKVLLPRFKDAPEPFKRLLDYTQPATSAFRDLIRVYNGMFCFTSFRARIDHSINKGRGLYTFRINRQNYHRIGSLLPTEGTQPRYAQLWFFDTHNEIQNQLGAFMDTDSEEGVDGTIVGSLIRMLDANSAIAKAFQMARDWCHADATANVELRLLSERTRSKQYNALTVAEVAALITNDFGDGEPIRDIAVFKKDSPPKRISELHPSYMALQYPLLFPYGEYGYHEKIPYHTNKGKRKITRDYVTMKEYYAYVIQYRKDEWTTLHRGFIGGPRYMMQNYQDAMALCHAYGNPCLFITFTSNPKCPEINEILAYIPGQRSHDRPEVGTRVFKLKLTELLDDLTKNHVFRAISAVVYVIEFQKRGLPHAHILIWLKEYYRCKAATDIDDIISAELSSPTADPAGYKAMSYYMLHGLCGKDNRAATCNMEGKKMSSKAKNQQPVTLHDTDCLPALLQKEEKKWRPRKQRKCIARIVYSTPSAAERYFLRMLLNVVRGPRKLEHLLMVNDRICSTFKEACFAYGLLNDDKEWTRAIQEASLWALGPQLRHLFVTILLFCDLTKEQIQNYCLMEIQDLLNTNGRALTEFSDMPQPNPTLLTSVDNRLIREARAFDMNKSRIQHQQLYPQLNPEQRLIYEEVVDSVHNKKGQFHFVYGPGGTGKTFLYKTIISRLRSELKIVLVVASSGIASLLLPGGRTAHSRFVIPLELLENSTCGIKQNTHLAELMQQVELIIWDEAPMTQKYAFEALDKTLRDILGYPVPEKRNKIFGGMTVLLGGDFRQILPVIPKGKRADIIQACINYSELWKHCKVSTLKQSMRVNEYTSNDDIDTRKQTFNQWVLAVGDGKVPARIKDGEDEPTWIEIPETFLIPLSESPIQQIVEETYPNFIQRQKDDAYLRERAILTPRNDDADAINAYMFDKLAGEGITYQSTDEICKGSTDTLDQHNLYPTEFLNTLNFQGMPPHALT